MNKSLQQFYILSLWCVLLCLGFVNAQDISQNPQGSQIPQQAQEIKVPSNPIGTPNKDATSIIIGTLGMVIGLLFVFVGKRLIRFLLAIAGAVTFFLLTISLSSCFVNFDQATKTQSIIILVAAGIFAITGGVLAACLWKVGMVILGFANGFSLGQIVTRTFVAKPWVQIIIMVSVGLVFSIFTCFAMNFVTIAYTSFFGAHIFISGVDLIANTGYNQFNTSSVVKGEVTSLSPGAWAMFASVFVITIIGTLFQWKTNKSKTSTYQPVAAREIPEK